MARFRLTRPGRSRSPIALLSILGVGLLLIFILHATGILRPVEGIALRIVEPPLSVASRVGRSTGNWFSTIRSIGSLPKENAVLRDDVDRLKVEATRVEELERENALLKEQLGFVKESNLDTVPALVIGRPPFSEFQLIVIDKGERDGVVEGQAIVLANGLLVGRVFRVDSSTSQVLLLPDVHSAVHVVVQGSRANGIVQGDRGLGLLLTSLPQDAEINEGDRVLTTGLSGLFPKGLLLGTITDVTEPENDVFKEARVRPAVDFNELELVFLINQ